jgi:ABC-type Fe3+-hydroxamate transport system substrate-binding protein
VDQGEKTTVKRLSLKSEIITTEEIEREQLSQLKIINIIDNMTTLESYKSIWTLLEINPDVIIYFDSSTTM